MDKPHPDEIVAALKARLKSKRAHTNLQLVHDVCSKESSGDKDYSLAAIGRKIEARGGPKLNTLYAPGGRHYVELIRAWADWSGTAIQTAETPKDSIPDGSLLSRIENPAVRSAVGLKLAELRRLRRAVNELKAHAKITIDMRPQPPKEGSPVQVVALADLLLPEERTALESVLVESWLARNGWKEGPEGAVVRDKGDPRPIFRTGFLTGLRKLLGAQKPVTQ